MDRWIEAIRRAYQLLSITSPPHKTGEGERERGGAINFNDSLFLSNHNSIAYDNLALLFFLCSVCMSSVSAETLRFRC